MTVVAICIQVSETETEVIECGPMRSEEFSVTIAGKAFRQFPLTRPVCEELCSRLDEVPRVASARLEGLCALLGWVGAEHIALPQRAPGVETPNEHRAVREARRYVDECIAAEQLSLRHVAAHVGLNADYFSKLFQRVTGVSFTVYLNRKRVDRVRGMLTDDSRTMVEIALSSGFGSVPHFNRVFRQAMGMSPTEYRRKADIKISG